MYLDYVICSYVEFVAQLECCTVMFNVTRYIYIVIPDLKVLQS